MAKKPSDSPFAHALELFTAAERKILDASVATALAKAKHTQVEAATLKARVLRDKWRDLVNAQGRQTKRSAASTPDANARTQQKADLFGEAVERLETRLAELAAATGGVLPGKGTTTRAKARDKKISGRAARRTTARPEAPATVAKAAAAPAAKAKPTTSKIVALLPAARAPRASKLAAKPVAKPVAKTVSKKALVKRATLASPFGTQSIQLDRSKQQKAVAAAKAGKLKGLDTRRAGHAMSRGTKNQARRDSRGRG